MGLALSENQAKDLINDHRVVGVPCSGGQKYVFKCQTSGYFYAVKVICLQEEILRGCPEEEIEEAWDSASKRSKREFESMLRCSCNNLVRVLEGSYQEREIDGVKAIVFAEQWIEGYTLESYLASKRIMSSSELIKLALDIGQAIKELASKNLVHRDIKPSNIIFDEEADRFVLLDLGLALDLNESYLTQTGLIVGTRPYLAPEQMNPKYKPEITFKSDFFALGTVLYELATGERPYFKKSYMDLRALYNGIMNGPVPVPPCVKNEDICGELSGIIMRLLAKRPSGRYRHPQNLIEALEAIGG